MRILFLHTNFPGQYRHLAHLLAGSGHQVVFATANPEGSLAGVEKRLFKAHRAVRQDIHHYVRPLEHAVLNGQASVRAMLQLKREGFAPDVVCAHSGWGAGQYVKDVFPESGLVGLFEWYYRPHGSDVDFLREAPITDDDLLRIRTKNAPILLDLVAADRRVAPTHWQRRQFPDLFQREIEVLHDGIDTEYFSPLAGARLQIARFDLRHVDEIVTYVARGMEPYRGFPEMIKAAALLQARRPRLHVVVVGADRVAYGRPLPAGQTYKQKLLAETPGLDLERIHFTGLLPFTEYRQVLRASSVHLYLTVPFVLSWSMLEAMASGCLVVGSRTPPVEEAIEDGVNGLLVDFADVEAIAAGIEAALDDPAGMAPLRRAARRTVVERYDLQRLLPRHLEILAEAAAVAKPVQPVQAASLSSRLR
jgi:glycosyltransferase involved in cell wall biosynthesis